MEMMKVTRKNGESTRPEIEHDGDTVSGEVVTSEQCGRKELTKKIKYPYYNLVGLRGWWRRQEQSVKEK